MTWSSLSRFPSGMSGIEKNLRIACSVHMLKRTCQISWHISDLLTTKDITDLLETWKLDMPKIGVLGQTFWSKCWQVYCIRTNRPSTSVTLSTHDFQPMNPGYQVQKKRTDKVVCSTRISKYHMIFRHARSGGLRMLLYAKLISSHLRIGILNLDDWYTGILSFVLNCN